MVSGPPSDRLDREAALLSALANRHRLAIIYQLLDRETPVGAMAEKIGLSQSALSQHLAKLRGINLVSTRRERQMIYYACRSEAVRALVATLDSIHEESLRDAAPERARAPLDPAPPK